MKLPNFPNFNSITLKRKSLPKFLLGKGYEKRKKHWRASCMSCHYSNNINSSVKRIFPTVWATEVHGMDKNRQQPGSASASSVADDHPSDINAEALAMIDEFFKFSTPIPPNLSHPDAYSDLFRSCLKVQSIERGKISCLLTVKLPILVIQRRITITS